MIEFELNRSGILFVISAPSGGGKSTIIRALLDNDSTLSYSISATTRPSRRGEKTGKEYHFLSKEEFEKLIKEDAFLEYATVHGNYYGTPKSEIDNRLQKGQDVILDLDVQGSQRVKKAFQDSVTIFILPPSLATLERRLRERGLDDEDAIKNRLANARTELRMADRYDYVIVNRQLDETIQTIKSVIAAERQKAHRLTLKDALGAILMSSFSDA